MHPMLLGFIVGFGAALYVVFVAHGLGAIEIRRKGK